MRPTPRTLGLAALLLLPATFAAISPSGAALFWFTIAGVGALLLGDVVWALLLPKPVAVRTLQSNLALGVQTRVTLRISNRGAAALRLLVSELHPPELVSQGLPQRCDVPAAGFVELSFALRPIERGEMVVGGTELLMNSRLGLWQRRLLLDNAQTVRVYPNFRAVANYGLAAVENRLSLLGVRKQRRRGEGMEFHQLREYRFGDSPRQVDWLATSRLRKLVSREYRDERNQQLLFLLDCGRAMRAKDGDLSHLDHALDAVLLLSYVALRQGDAVGLMTFGGQRRWLEPRTGPGQLHNLLNTTFTLQATTDAGDIASAIARAEAKLRKRTLVILVSNLREFISDEMVKAVQLSARRHLVLLASLREKVLAAALEPEIVSLADALRVGATHAFLDRRRRLHHRLNRAGVNCVDIEPQQLPIALVNRYLAIKASGRL